MSDLDTLFTALADERRRYVLSCLQEHQEIPLPDLAELVAELEYDELASDLSGRQVTDVYFTLYHTHVPLLEEADLLQYDQEGDLVAQETQAKSHLDRARKEIATLL